MNITEASPGNGKRRGGGPVSVSVTSSSQASPSQAKAPSHRVREQQALVLQGKKNDCRSPYVETTSKEWGAVSRRLDMETWRGMDTSWMVSVAKGLRYGRESGSCYALAVVPRGETRRTFGDKVGRVKI